MTLHPPVGPNDHSQGREDAPVTLVEYGDYQCPVCGEAFPIVQRIRQEFGDRLRFVFRNFPIAELHPQAVAAANVAEFCGEGGEFWPAHDGLYEHQEELGAPLYDRIAKRLGLSGEAAIRAAESNEYGDRIEADLEGGIRSGVNGTPTFFVNGERVVIERSFEELVDAIERALER